MSQSQKLSLLLNTSFVFLLSFYLYTNSKFPSQSKPLVSVNPNSCSALHEYTDYDSKCSYIKSHGSCQPKGYMNYLYIFYCICGQFPLLGHIILLLWLLLLFYLLGNTSAKYFCNSLESLSRVLNLSPTLAGVTLLPLGNGAGDVFIGIISFTASSSGSSQVGLNSVLGSAFFVSSVILGVISILITPLQITLDKTSFIRDGLFFLFSLSMLLLIIIIGKINLWGAIGFVSIYFFYVCAVSATHLLCGKSESTVDDEEVGKMGLPLLGYVDDDTRRPILQEKEVLGDTDPGQGMKFLGMVLYVMELPLYLPRRLTIPVVSEEEWSKPFAVISVTLAPTFVAMVCSSQTQKLGYQTKLMMYIVTFIIGVSLGNTAFVTTDKHSPPKRCLFIWLGGGFLMSVTWTFITAKELVSLLVSIGYILEISPSLLGLTVLAWGNSSNDLITNVSMAVNGGPDGAQIAISGCYAAPMFNTLMGLGLSLLFSSHAKYPSSYVIPRDPSVYGVLVFLICGLLWALAILPKRKMRLDRFLGYGLLVIYFSFLLLRLGMAIGF